jgi:hypothetical protein
MISKARKKLTRIPSSTHFLFLALLLGGLIRLIPVMNADFPINDGGLFYHMTQDLVENSFKLPQFTTYNNLQIPYAYPPLGFYMAGALNKFAGWELLDSFRFLPAIFSILSIPAFYFLAKGILHDDTAVGLSVLIFSFLPIGYEWFLMGGGITRSPGLFFSLIALYFGYQGFTNGKWFTVLLTAIFSATCVLLHPEAAAHIVIGQLLFFLFKGRSKKGFQSAVLILLGVILLTCPWWIKVIRDHGISPIFAASKVGVDGAIKYINLILFNFTGESGMTSIAFLAFIGIFYSIQRKQFLIPLWLIISFLIAQRGEIIALLAGVTLAAVLEQFSRSHFKKKNETMRVKSVSGILSSVLLIFLIIQWVYSGISMSTRLTDDYQLSESDISAMEWVKENTADSSNFLIMSGLKPLLDPVSEWFPALTNRQSAATVQGKEWMPQIDFDEAMNDSMGVQNCVLQDMTCIEDIRKDVGWDYDYIFLRKFINTQSFGFIPTVGLSKTLSTSSIYTQVFETDSIIIYKVEP